MNTLSKSILIIMASFASIPTAVAIDEPRRLLRLPNSDADDTNHRILQSSSMSMATESMDTVGPNMEVINAIVSKVEKEGEEVDPAALMLANLALVEFDESAMHHHGGYEYTDKCLKLLFILLPDYKASKLSFICGEETAPNPSPTPSPTSQPTSQPTPTPTPGPTPSPTACINPGGSAPGADCTSSAQCCSNGKYIILLTHHIVH